MELINLPIILTCLLTLLFSGLTLTALALKKEKNLLQRQLTETGNALRQTKKELDEIHNKHDKIIQFQSSLAEAELTTKLQKPRLSAQEPSINSSAPERYRFVHSLTKNGMDADEIAKILTISSHEAQQLVALAKLAQPPVDAIQAQDKAIKK